MAKKRAVKKKIAITAAKVSASGKGMLLAIVALILNIFLPGLGSLIAGRIKEGIWQLVVLVIGLLVYQALNYLLGLIVIVVALIWAIFTAISVIKQSQ